uniref:Uncharacterized protein n=1 Tax=Romanomermis culicivorax TaxID=13658 RepID=A0A915JXM6_ROMCU
MQSLSFPYKRYKFHGLVGYTHKNCSLVKIFKVKQFLRKNTSSSSDSRITWKDEYIASLVTIGTPWLGALSAFLQYLQCKCTA